MGETELHQKQPVALVKTKSSLDKQKSFTAHDSRRQKYEVD